MKWAKTANGKALANPGSIGFCPICGNDVVAKCGKILVWHWAHKTRDCDPWSEPESQWHLGWKGLFPPDWQEVVMGSHRADVRTPLCVIEFQKSAISVEEIREREQFYGQMIWVVEASNWWLTEYDSFEKKLPAGMARWLWPRKTWEYALAPIFLDVGDSNLWLITALYQKNGFRTKETIIDYQEFTKRQFLERVTGIMSHQNLLTPYYHPFYNYLKNLPDMLPPWPA